MNLEVQYEGQSDTGYLIFLKGHEYPMKGQRPTQEAVTAMDEVKALTLYFLRFESCIRPRKTWNEYIRIISRIVSPHRIPTQNLTPVSREVFLLLMKVTRFEIAEAAAHVLELDNSYRLRFQDLCTETTQSALLEHPFKEIHRLLSINKRRDLPEVNAKLIQFAWCISIALCIPRVRRALRECEWQNLYLDESDKYWLKIRTDYLYNG